ncbi:hypothetical protein Hanom_Chr06g00497221 [Helianthus anomalus]
MTVKVVNRCSGCLKPFGFTGFRISKKKKEAYRTPFLLSTIIGSPRSHQIIFLSIEIVFPFY